MKNGVAESLADFNTFKRSVAFSNVQMKSFAEKELSRRVLDGDETALLPSSTSILVDWKAARSCS